MYAFIRTILQKKKNWNYLISILIRFWQTSYQTSPSLSLSLSRESILTSNVSQIPRNYSNHVKSLPFNRFPRNCRDNLEGVELDSKATIYRKIPTFPRERKKGNVSYLQRGHVGHGSMSLNGFQLVQAPVQLLHSLHRQFHVVFLWKEENKGRGWNLSRKETGCWQHDEVNRWGGEARTFRANLENSCLFRRVVKLLESSWNPIEPIFEGEVFF